MVLELTAADQRWARDLVYALRAQEAYVVPERLPDRGGEDYMGVPDQPGIPAIKLAENAADSMVLAGGDTNAERAVDSEHIKDAAVVRRTIAENAISGTEIAANSVGDGHVSGRFGHTVLPPDTVYGNAQGNLSYGNLTGAFPGVTRNELNNILRNYKKIGGGN